MTSLTASWLALWLGKFEGQAAGHCPVLTAPAANGSSMIASMKSADAFQIGRPV